MLVSLAVPKECRNGPLYLPGPASLLGQDLWYCLADPPGLLASSLEKRYVFGARPVVKLRPIALSLWPYFRRPLLLFARGKMGKF